MGRQPYDAETRNAMQQAAEEIRQLRKSNHIMSAQLDVLETIRLAVGGPRKEDGRGDDVAWRISKLLDEDSANLVLSGVVGGER